MRHLFGKEHKEQKSVKLVKKLQLEEDKKWQEELQRRLEQEEKDAAFARELQEQMASDTTSPSSTSPITLAGSSPTVLSPPPLPVKPTAYNSSRPTTSSLNSSSGNNVEQQRTRPLASPLTSNSAPSSSSSSAIRQVPPPPYQAGQPRLPPRERTVSQASTPNLSSTNNNNSTIVTPPSHSRPSHSHHHSAYLPALNTAVTPGIGHQTLNPQPYYPSTPQQQDMYPPFGTPQPQHQVTTNFQVPRRDPAMLIIPPPRKEKQPTTTTTRNDSAFTSSMPMPEPVRTTTPFNPYSSASLLHTTSASMSNIPTGSSSLPATTTSVLTPTPAPIKQNIHTSTPPPPITTSTSYHSLPVTMSNTIGKSTVTRVSPKMTSNLLPAATPITSSQHYILQPTKAKPDTKVGIQNTTGSSGSSTFIKAGTHQHNTRTMAKTMDQDDSDEDEPLFWERNDGRMMASTPKITSTPVNQQQQHGHQDKHMAATRHINEDYDSEDGSDFGDDDSDQVDDHAIDLFNIKANDNVTIHQHVKSAQPSFGNITGDNKTETHNRYQDDDTNHDPFADSFAVSDSNTRGSNKSEFTPSTIIHERSRSAGVIDVKPAFQMNTKSSTIAKVHDPLLMMASKAGSGVNTSSPAVSRPSRPTSTLPWNSTQFSASSASIISTSQPPIGSTIPRPASVYQHPLHQIKSDDDDDLITLDSDDIQLVVPTNVLRAGAPPNIQSMITQMTAEVPSNEFGYYQYQTNKPGGEKEEIEEAMVKALPKLPKCKFNWKRRRKERDHTNIPSWACVLLADPDHRHITVPSVIEDQRVWIRVHPTDTGKSLASRIQIVATYKTRKILKITTDKGRPIALDDTPVFKDWAGVMEMEDGAPWKVEWTVLDHNLWEGPKEFLRYLKATLRS
ncbi:hypothetical protein BC941DRAFT_201941 [Chlamydoabsidia padenii]|nr:hypothetical protein BC941DRAFT_201941 [Chlamydoabsidia padenii]